MKAVCIAIVAAVLAPASLTSAQSFPERALISGVPRYYQDAIDLPAPCESGFPSGCGPVTGATILGWWTRQGVNGLMLTGVAADGLPQDTIFELGRGQYMDRIAFCEGTAVEPYRFKSGLQKYLDDFASVPFYVSK